MSIVDVDWSCSLSILFYGDLLEGRLFVVELCQEIILISLFDSTDSKVNYRGMRSDRVIMINEFVKYMGDTIVVN
jgi:hypothetical protein